MMPSTEIMQIKEESPEEQDKGNESHEGIEENEEEEMQRPVAVYLPVKVEPEDEEDGEKEEEEEEEVNRPVYHPVKVEKEEEEDDGDKEENEEEDEDELAHPVAVFLMTKEEPKEEIEDPADFSDACVDEEISESVTYKTKMNEDIVEFKKKFNEAFFKLSVSKKKNSAYISSSLYEELVREVKRMKEEKNNPMFNYRRLKRYDVVRVAGDERLIVPVSEGETTLHYYVTNENVFDVLHEAHLNVGHGGKHKMIMELKKKYANVTQEAILLFLKHCVPCQEKRTSTRKGLVDIIDMQTHADGDYHFILVYQDLLTKFVQLRALTSKRAEEVAEHLLNIFCIFGAPSVLQSYNGAEFANRIIESLKRKSNSLAIVHGQLCHSQSQGSVERTNQKILNRLATWMKTEGIKAWSQGLKYVQLMKNNVYHESIKRSPYKAMFGHDMKVRLNSFELPRDVMRKLTTEEELEKLLKDVTKEQDINTNLPECLDEHSMEMLDEEKEDVHTTSTEQSSLQIENIKKIACGVCGETSSNNFTLCNSCNTFIHTTCSVEDTHDKERNNFGVLCHLCRKKKCIATN